MYTYFYIIQQDANIPKEHISETTMICGHVAHPKIGEHIYACVELNMPCVYVRKSCMSQYGAYWNHIHPLRQQKVCADIRHTPA